MLYFKKLIPYLFVVVLAVIAFFVKQCRESRLVVTEQNATEGRNSLDVFRDPQAEYYFTKHARCRMKCRQITQKEVKEIVQKANVNYGKSELDGEEGPKYAMEGYTFKEDQHVRIIVAPKQKHLSIVTVIDLDRDWECPSCK